jgi:hypothetical protein
MINYAAVGPIELEQSKQLPLMLGVPTTAKLIILLESILFNYISIVIVRLEYY